MEWVVPLGLGLMGMGQQQQSSNAQSQAAAAQAAGAAGQEKVVDYILNKRQNVYDPIEEGTILPALKSRATSAPDWAPQAGFWSKQLASKMSFPTQDQPRPSAAGTSAAGTSGLTGG